MEKQLTPQEARERLQALVNDKRDLFYEPTLAEAKEKLREIDQNLGLPHVASLIDKRDYKGVLYSFLFWTFSQNGQKALVPLATSVGKLLLLKPKK
jgi:hypothetical protein